MKKLLKVVLAVSVIVMALTFSAVADNGGSCGNGVSWSFDDGILTVSGNGEMYDYAFFDLPPWRSYMSDIEKVIIENGVTSIGNEAFASCNNLTAVEMADSVVTIGSRAFNGCNRLVSVTSSDSLKAVEHFNHVTTLVDDRILDSVSCELRGNFDNYYVSIPNGVISIGEEAFADCSKISTVLIPGSVRTIGDSAFARCSEMSAVVIKNGVTQMGHAVFAFNTHLVLVVLPGSIQSFGDYVFDECRMLRFIYGIEGSKSQTYAKINDFTFSKISNSVFGTSIILTINETNAVVNGTDRANDVAPVIVNSRTMLPARFVAENLGAEVLWNDAEQKVTIKSDAVKIEIVIGSDTAYVNGKAKTLDSPAFISNSRTYVPVRFICESLGADVKWIAKKEQVVITK